ncbi:MAG: hypothetical protein KME64_40460 [Scytonematopsis contorta HA4267-MV1]|nr:hypothetical protein [Scytonematopsis contorta HA4267-MV1]
MFYRRQERTNIILDCGFLAKPLGIAKHSYQLPITNYQSPIPNYQSPITNYQLPITNYQLQITNYQ